MQGIINNPHHFPNTKNACKGHLQLLNWSVGLIPGLKATRVDLPQPGTFCYEFDASAAITQNTRAILRPLYFPKSLSFGAFESVPLMTE